MKEPSTIRRLAENIPFLSRHDETAEDELPLDSLERTGFLPTPQPAQSRGGRLATRSSWPPKDLAQVSSRKIIPLIASGSIVIILFMFWLRGSEPHLPLDVPPQSSELARKLASELIDTKIHPYILHYAPLVFLDTREKFYPSDLREHLRHTHPALNYTPITGFSSRIGLSNLASLNASGGEDIFLTLNEDSQVTGSSKFLEGHKPDKKTLQTFGRSCAVITHDWGEGTIDAYYMYFYTFNQGPTVLGKEIGDHVGDWEHNMIRFHDMIPQAIWYSQHSYGEAYTYDAVEKIGKRPVVYSAKGSHANYPTAGKHDLSVIEPRIPAGIAFDYTSTGALWDPTLSAFFHKFWPETRTFSTIRIGDPDSYLLFNGKWGDKQYPDDDPIQMVYEGEYHKFTSGPNGPLFKHLDRTDVCLDDSRPCVIREKL